MSFGVQVIEDGIADPCQVSTEVARINARPIDLRQQTRNEGRLKELVGAHIDR